MTSFVPAKDLRNTRRIPLAKPVARHLSARRSLGEGGRLWEPAGVSPGRNVYLRKIAVDQIVEDY